MSCLSCGRGFHDECGEPCCCPKDEVNSSVQTGSIQNDDYARGSDVGISAGRKRAAVIYEIDKTQPCEWRGKANCGGGYTPVVGCIMGFQTDRHHGPDKNTTNNSRENVHLICKPCHNLWHRRNDEPYGNIKCPDDIQLHDPRWATAEELMIRDPSEV